MMTAVDTNASIGTAAKPKQRRFNDERIRQAMQSFHERQLLGSKSLSYSSTHTLELTEAAKSQLPPIRCTSANIEVHEYYRVMKSATLYSAALGWVVIVTAFVEGELTWRRGGNDTLFADCLRALNI